MRTLFMLILGPMYMMSMVHEFLEHEFMRFSFFFLFSAFSWVLILGCHGTHDNTNKKREEKKIQIRANHVPVFH